MKRIVTTGAVLASGVGALLARRLRGAGPAYRSTSDEPRSRWQAVTILRAPEEVMPAGRIPEPLAQLGDLVDVEVRPASRDRGTELRARLKDTSPASPVARVTGQDPRQQVRSALREAKQLLEVGEVLRVDPVPHGKRTPTPGGLLVELATKRAPGEGVL